MYYWQGLQRQQSSHWLHQLQNKIKNWAYIQILINKITVKLGQQAQYEATKTSNLISKKLTGVISTLCDTILSLTLNPWWPGKHQKIKEWKPKREDSDFCPYATGSSKYENQGTTCKPSEESIYTHKERSLLGPHKMWCWVRLGPRSHAVKLPLVVKTLSASLFRKDGGVVWFHWLGFYLHWSAFFRFHRLLYYYWILIMLRARPIRGHFCSNRWDPWHHC